MKCPNCQGVGVATNEDPCKMCGGSGEVSGFSRQDSATPFNDENTKHVPDKPGVWFNHITRLPVHVIRKDDGELYFQGGTEGEEEMKVSEYARLKADSAFAEYGFTKLVTIIDSPIKPSYN